MCLQEYRSEQRCRVIVLNRKKVHDEGHDSIHKAFHTTSTLSSACGSQWALTRPKAIIFFRKVKICGKKAIPSTIGRRGQKAAGKGCVSGGRQGRPGPKEE